MTKRFTPKASTYSERLARVQKHLSVLKKKASVLEAEEKALKAFLLDFYDNGVTEVTTAKGKTLEVTLSSYEREYLDQEKAQLLLRRKGIKIPKFTSKVIILKVK